MIYIDTDDYPWDDASPELTGDCNQPYVIHNTPNGVQHWVGVRCRDSVAIPNIDTNVVLLSETPTGGGGDTTPPVWDGTVIVEANSDPGMIYVEWGDAHDADSPPVTYLVYLSQTNPPWGATPVEKLDTEHWHQFNSVTPGYWYVGVRAQDSAAPPNIDQNVDIWGLDVQ